MMQTAVDVYNKLLTEAIDCNEIIDFSYYASMTTAHAQRKILSLLYSCTLYKYNDGLLVKYFDKLCFIRKDEQNTVRVLLPFSPKHLCFGRYTNKDLRNIEESVVLNDVIFSLIGI